MSNQHHNQHQLLRQHLHHPRLRIYNMAPPKQISKKAGYRPNTLSLAMVKYTKPSGSLAAASTWLSRLLLDGITPPGRNRKTASLAGRQIR